MTTHYGSNFPASLFLVNACHSFMEHAKYVHEMENTFPTMHEALSQEMQGNENWYTRTKYTEIFPQIHRRSIFISTFGLLEFFLIRFNLVCKQDLFITQNVKQTGTVEESFKYLTNFANFNMKNCEKLINYFNLTYKLRNSLTHRAGILNEKELVAYRGLDDEKLSVTKHDEIILKKGFCDEFVSKCKVIFALLDEPLEEQLQSVYGFYAHLNGEQQINLWNYYQERHNKNLNTPAGGLGQ